MNNSVKDIFRLEIQELTRLADSFDNDFQDRFDAVIELILKSSGKLVLMGIGKTGIIAHKIASSLASTGTSAIFVNAAEAVHGDLGMVAREDIVILVSNSGATSEILNVIAPLKTIGCRLMALTGNPQSALAKECDHVLSVHIDKEVCPLGLAPTTSTTATLIMGDALMVSLMNKRCFKAENFAIYHPGGALGRQLLHTVGKNMTRDIPCVQPDATLCEFVKTMSNGHLGMTLVGTPEKPIGIITDGDLRRALEKHTDLNNIRAEHIMTRSFKTIEENALLTDALALIDRYNITTLPVTPTRESKNIVGILSIHHIIDFE